MTTKDKRNDGIMEQILAEEMQQGAKQKRDESGSEIERGSGMTANADQESKNHGASAHTSLWSRMISSVYGGYRSQPPSSSLGPKNSKETKENEEVCLEEDPHETKLRELLKETQEEFGRWEITTSIHEQELAEQERGSKNNANPGLFTPKPHLLEGSDGLVGGTIIVPPADDVPADDIKLSPALSFRASQLDSSLLQQEENSLTKIPTLNDTSPEEKYDLKQATTNGAGTPEFNTNNWGASFETIGRQMYLSEPVVTQDTANIVEGVPKNGRNISEAKFGLLAGAIGLFAVVSLCLFLGFSTAISEQVPPTMSEFEISSPLNDISTEVLVPILAKAVVSKAIDVEETVSVKTTNDLCSENELGELPEISENIMLPINASLPSLTIGANTQMKHSSENSAKSLLLTIPEYGGGHYKSVIIFQVVFSGLILLGVLFVVPIVFPNMFLTMRPTLATSSPDIVTGIIKTTIKKPDVKGHQLRKIDRKTSNAKKWLRKNHDSNDVFDSVVKAEVLTKGGNYVAVRRSARHFKSVHRKVIKSE